MTVDPFEVSLRELRGSRGTRQVTRSTVLTEPLVADVDSRVPAGAEVVADLTLEVIRRRRGCYGNRFNQLGRGMPALSGRSRRRGS